MKTLYGRLKPDGELAMDGGISKNLFATTNKSWAKKMAMYYEHEMVRLEVRHFFITPQRTATSARNEEKQMAAKPKAKKVVAKAAPKAAKKVNGKKGKC